MGKKIKIRVHMNPLSFADGAKFAKEREVDVIIEDSGNEKYNRKAAVNKACLLTDCNRYNYAFGTREI